MVVDKSLHTDAQKNTTQGQLHKTHIRESMSQLTCVCGQDTNPHFPMGEKRVDEPSHTNILLPSNLSVPVLCHNGVEKFSLRE